MYKILHIPSGLVLDIPSDINKEEANKTIKWLCRLHKQYMVASFRTQRHMGYANLLSKFDHLYEDELEAFFISETKKRFQITDVATLAMYPGYWPSEKAATHALATALRKQHDGSLTTLRKWCLRHIPAASVTGSLFDNFKTDWTNKIGHFNVVEV
ncbi:MAG: hypothetical protein JHC33_01945 [Ignisphaera sp.]|nr:hypothetical protein [Ignisphaera sp.]